MSSASSPIADYRAWKPTIYPSGSYMEQAISLAEEIEPVKGFRVYAILTHRGNVIGEGFNQMKSHPFQAKYANHPQSIFWHAETMAIKSVLNHQHLIPRLYESIMWVARVGRKGQPSLAKPCKGCQGCIDAFAIPTVYYTTSEV